MAYFSFTRAILEGRPINLYHHGQARRDFTYIDDVVEAIARLLSVVPGYHSLRTVTEPSNCSRAPYRIYNIGNSEPIELSHFVQVLERCLGRPAKKRLLPAQPGDVRTTFADTSQLHVDIGFEPNTSIDSGLARFTDWYRHYYRV
jgi:UDP-glucuronate 4-epimerase